MAAALPEDGELLSLDISAEYTDIARRYWQEVGLGARIALRLAPALESLQALEREGQGGRFDLVFVDADKTGYPAYLEHALRLLRPGGLVLFDNTLWGGRVLEAAPESADTRAVQALNRALRDDPRIELSLLPLGDGLSICRKRETAG